jgi:hypothetical protein
VAHARFCGGCIAKVIEAKGKINILGALGKSAKARKASLTA